MFMVQILQNSLVPFAVGISPMHIPNLLKEIRLDEHWALPRVLDETRSFSLIAFTIDWFWPHPCCINPEIWQHLRNWMFCLQLPSWKNPTKPKHAPPSGVEVTICSRSRGARPWQMVQKLTKNTFLTQTLADYVGIFDQKTDQTENNWPKTCGRSCFCWGRLAPASTRQTASWFWSTFLTWRFKTEKPPGPPADIQRQSCDPPKVHLGAWQWWERNHPGFGVWTMDFWPQSGRTI